MYRYLSVLFIGGLLAVASPLSVSVTCGSTTNTASGPDVFPGLLVSCSEDGLNAGASVGILLYPMEAVAQTSSGGTGLVEARSSIAGLFSMQLDKPGPAVLFFAPCPSASITGTGVTSASMTFGPFTMGDPCDFDHAFPINSDTPVFFEVFGAAYATTDATVTIDFYNSKFFDPRGDLYQGAFTFSLEFVNDLPEPSTSILAAIGLIAIAGHALPMVHRRTARRRPQITACCASVNW